MSATRDDIVRLHFQGVWNAQQLELLPRTAGVFCVYRQGLDEERGVMRLRELLYIGSGGDVRASIIEGLGSCGWGDRLDRGEKLAFSVASCEANAANESAGALTQLLAPPCNTPSDASCRRRRLAITGLVDCFNDVLRRRERTVP